MGTKLSVRCSLLLLIDQHTSAPKDLVDMIPIVCLTIRRNNMGNPAYERLSRHIPASQLVMT